MGSGQGWDNIQKQKDGQTNGRERGREGGSVGEGREEKVKEGGRKKAWLGEWMIMDGPDSLE